ncbi:MAG: YebC/PmpR family DNA-binding transcriptional regulator [Pseudomonadota bacterium]
MSGHSKWSQIKRQKGVADARRGQLFTKFTREITVAVRQGGSNPEANFRLRLAIQKARDNNMPLENIERAIKRASGAVEAASYAEFTLEVYGAHGVAILVQVMTDNRNRAIQEVRGVLTHRGGSLGESGSVAWLFEQHGVITIEISDETAEDLALAAIDVGAEDVNVGKGYLEIYTQPQSLEEVRRAIENERKVVSAELSWMPKSTVMLDEKASIQTLKLLDQLEELDDVQRVFSNIDFSEAVLERLSSQT